MKFRSVSGKSPTVDFSTALLQGLAPDGSLYVPEAIPKFSPSELARLESSSLQETAFAVLAPFVGDIPATDLRDIVERSFNFPIPLVQLDEEVELLELFHGPTLAFKDVGARFMAGMLSHILSRQDLELTIAVATSGDTGSAVAQGFYNLPHISVLVLYPSGKISRLQEQQMTTLGGNIQAIEVDGNFDDCQRLVKQALSDGEVNARRRISTANSINVGRLLPQIVYYFWAAAQCRKRRPAVVADLVVPSGNFGNLTAALYAKHMGLPVGKCIAAINANDAFARYLATGKLTSLIARQTLSNAMDVGSPSNIARIQSLFVFDIERLRSEIGVCSVTDEDTLKEIAGTFARSHYALDPHSAVGVAAARQRSFDGEKVGGAVVMATAHPAKFPEVMNRALGMEIPLPPALSDVLSRLKQSLRMSPDYKDFKAFLLS